MHRALVDFVGFTVFLCLSATLALAVWSPYTFGQP
jgi:hypothetical protein